MITHTVLEICCIPTELDGDRAALFLRLKNGPNYGVDAYDSTQNLNIDFRGDADDPTSVGIDPVFAIEAVIDEPGALPEPNARYNYANKDLNIDVQGVTFRELVRAVLVALDGDYDRIWWC